MDLRYLKVLLFLAITQSLAGRRYISSKLGLGEGVVRRLLEAGREAKHISVNRAGVKITEEGIRYLAEAMSICGLKPLAYSNKFGEKLCGKICVAFSLRRPVENIVKFRDEVVRRGSCGAVVAYMKGGFVYIPLADMLLEDLDADMAQALKKVLKEGEVVVIACGDNFGQALAPLDVVCNVMM
ncbi:MAG: DUF4443 domain-containing protein [Thermoproteus sp.]